MNRTGTDLRGGYNGTGMPSDGTVSNIGRANPHGGAWMAQGPVSFMPRPGMMGSRVPVNPMSVTTPGAKAALVGQMAAQRGPAYNNAGEVTARARQMVGQSGMPSPHEQPLTQFQRESMAASYGPQNAALAGYMAG